MENIFRTPYNYISLRRFGAPCVFQERHVRVADTAVKQDGASFSDVNSQSADSFYTNSDVPIKVFGPGVLSTAHNPFSHGVIDASKVESGSAESAVVGSAASEVAAASASVVENSNS